jgi:lipoate-protein ligase B
VNFCGEARLAKPSHNLRWALKIEAIGWRVTLSHMMHCLAINVSGEVRIIICVTNDL